MKRPEFDEGGYPADSTLEAIKLWPLEDMTGLLKFVRMAWRWPDLWKQEGDKLKISTGGWSGNEALIEALRETMFWFLCWEESRRGGHYTFDLSRLPQAVQAGKGPVKEGRVQTLHGGILNDREITALCNTKEPMIKPFSVVQAGKPSSGLGSFGYDIRLGQKFFVPLGGVNAVLDPLDFPHETFRVIETSEVFELAPHSQVLAESVEEFQIPEDVFGLCYGKSTYARCGLLVNVTPLEPQWKGRLTLELANLSPLPIRLHVGKGIAQVVFFRGERPKRTYSEKEAGGIYQGQGGVTLPQ